MRVGFLGGTFDPIHFGHIHIAIALAEAHSLDQVLFCPARLSPDKQGQPPLASPQQRKKMIELVMQELPQCSLFDWELHREGPSYTIETLRHWKKDHKEPIFLLLGSDVLPSLPHWREIDALLDLAPPLIGSRSIEEVFRVQELMPKFKEKIVAGHTTIPVLEISSTLVRRRLFERKYCGHLVPASVLEFIFKNRLYL